MDFSKAARIGQAVAHVQRRWRGYQERREHHGFVLRAGGAKDRRRRFSSVHDVSEALVAASHPSADKARRRTLSAHQSSQLVNAAHWHSRSRALSKLSKLTRGASTCSHPMLMMPALWIEATDKKHRYGGNLKHYHERWLCSDTAQGFFEWLDHGDGRGIDLADAPRAELESNRVIYCDSHERARYAVCVDDDGSLLYQQSRRRVGMCPSAQLEDPKAKLIFVMAPDTTLYINAKKRGRFHHSSFLAGGSALAAGSMVVEGGRLVEITPHSGHYRPTGSDFERMLKILGELGIPMAAVRLGKPKPAKKAKKGAAADSGRIARCGSSYADYFPTPSLGA